MYKVFINNNLLYLLTKQEIEEIPHDKTHLILCEKKINLLKAVEQLHSTNDVQSFFLIGNPKKLLKQMKDEFKYIKAAGGLVKNNKGQVLLIFRNKHWDLPKGKMEKNESKEQGALREVIEECGLNSVELKNKLPSTYHMYNLHNNWYLKKTFWFEMFSEQEKLTPQTEEGIEKVIWLDKEQLSVKINEQMYASIKSLLQYYIIKT